MGNVDVTTRSALRDWLREERPERLEALFAEADRVRRARVGEDVHLRGLIEFSNVCARGCAYCGLRAERGDLARYRMDAREIVACAVAAASFGYGTVVLQSGEDPANTREAIAALVARIHAEAGLAIALSLGERSRDDLAAWRDAGAERYLLRFETSNPTLYARIHPAAPGGRDRFEVLRDLRDLGYEAGSGVLIGLPGQTWDDLARDLELFRELDLDMIGCGPWIPHPATPLSDARRFPPAAPEQQVPATEVMTYKVIALARLLCPEANIPATTALATLNTAQGREDALRRGANVLMPNCTPRGYRRRYDLYPAKACLDETAAECRGCMRQRIERIGRRAGNGRGASPGALRRFSANGGMSCPV